MPVGSIENPFDLQTAINSERIAPGDTIWIRAGDYNGAFVGVLSGSINNPIKIIPYPGESPVINGSLKLTGNWLDVRNLHVTNPAVENRDEAEGDVYTTALVETNGDYIRVVNCVLHGGGHGILAGGKGCEFYGNIIYDFGYKTITPPPLGHGIYVQNKIGTDDWQTVKHNLILDGFGYGVHAYSSLAKLDKMKLVENIIANCSILFGTLYPNFLVGGSQPFSDPVVDGNATYYTDGADPLGQCRVGYNDQDVTGAIITNNTLFGCYSLKVYNAIEPTIQGNRFYGSVDGFDPLDYPNNTYTSAVVPDTALVFANDYQAGRGHIAVYNGSEAASVQVDVSAVLDAGAAYRLRNAQDYFIDIATGEVDGNGLITIDMRAISHTVAAPIEWTAPATTFPTFGAFVIEEA